MSPVEAGAVAKERAAVARDSTGRRRLRCDGNVIGAVVMSFPVPRLRVEHDIVELTAYWDWRERCKAWLLAWAGDRLLSLVEHGDETYLHLHGYVVPSLLPNGQLDWHLFHHGRRAAAAAVAVGAPKRQQHAAYVKGMVAWQDDYHAAVGQACGHDRFGPRRRRRLRMDHTAEKAIAERKAAAEAEIANQRAETERQRAALETSRTQIVADTRKATVDELRKRWLEMRSVGTALVAEKAQLQRDAERLTGLLAVEAARRRSAEQEMAMLRQRLAQLEPAACAPSPR